MKVFVAVVFLATFVLLAKSSWQNLKPLDVMPVFPKYTAQKLSPEHYSDISIPQPEYAGKVHVPVDEQHQRITGGSTAVPGQFPWQAALIIDYSLFCGGCLISNTTVLTAAHCVAGASNIEVRLGATRLDAVEPGAISVVSIDTIIHPEYSAGSLANDIAIIELPNGTVLNEYIRPVQLPPAFLWDITNEQVTVSGWGKTSDGSIGISATLNYVNDIVISNSDCAYFYDDLVTVTKICTASTGGQSPCDGDSGGPLVYDINGVYNLVGIVSFGHAAGCELGWPTVYTRVTSHLAWINSVRDTTL